MIDHLSHSKVVCGSIKTRLLNLQVCPLFCLCQGTAKIVLKGAYMFHYYIKLVPHGMQWPLVPIWLRHGLGKCVVPSYPVRFQGLERTQPEYSWNV